jgi:hypothetical protein
MDGDDDNDDDRIQDGIQEPTTTGRVQGQETTMTMGRAALPAACNVRLVGSLECGHGWLLRVHLLYTSLVT